MLYGSYDFECEFVSDAFLPPYKGSTFRGAFGHSLKRAVCILRSQECETCLLRERCLYTHIFETHLAETQRNRTPNGTTPHPFVLVPPSSEQTDYQAGEGFTVGLILFGEVNRQMPYLVHVFQRMGTFGIGKGRSNGYGRFRLSKVRAGERIVFNDGGDGVNMEVCGETFPALRPRVAAPSATAAIETIGIRLLTPLRLKHGNRLESRLPFHLLVRAALRRAAELFTAFGGGEPQLDYSGLVREAESVRMTGSTIEWRDWRRYSNRQGRGMELGGMTGTAAYEGRLSPFLPLLELSERFHLGKQTSFGFGRLQLLYQPEIMPRQEKKASEQSSITTEKAVPSVGRKFIEERRVP